MWSYTCILEYQAVVPQAMFLIAVNAQVVTYNNQTSSRDAAWENDLVDGGWRSYVKCQGQVID